MSYLDEKGVNKLWTKCKAKFATKEEVDNLDVYTTSQVDSKLSVKADTSSVYTRAQINTALNNKYDVGHTHDSILDYGDTRNTIKIGYRGNGLTASQILYIAGYTAGDNANEHKIKDISKDVLKSWLGYAEVATGKIYNDSLNLIGGPYLWIVYPTSGSATTFSFQAGNSTYTGYYFAIVQSGTPGAIRYFTNAASLAMVRTTSVAFTTEVNYVRFKIDV